MKACVPRRSGDCQDSRSESSLILDHVLDLKDTKADRYGVGERRMVICASNKHGKATTRSRNGCVLGFPKSLCAL